MTYMTTSLRPQHVRRHLWLWLRTYSQRRVTTADFDAPVPDAGGQPFPYLTGLPGVFEAHVPPHHASMRAAVEAVVTRKFGKGGPLIPARADPTAKPLASGDRRQRSMLRRSRSRRSWRITSSRPSGVFRPQPPRHSSTPACRPIVSTPGSTTRISSPVPIYGPMPSTTATGAELRTGGGHGPRRQLTANPTWIARRLVGLHILQCWSLVPTARRPCEGPKSPRSTRKLETCVQSSRCWGTPKWTARCAILSWTLKMRSIFGRAMSLMRKLRSIQSS